MAKTTMPNLNKARLNQKPGHMAGQSNVLKSRGPVKKIINLSGQSKVKTATPGFHTVEKKATAKKMPHMKKKMTMKKMPNASMMKNPEQNMMFKPFGM